MCMCLSVEHILREMEGGLISSERSQMRHRGLWAGSTMAPFPVKTYQWVGVIMRTLWTEKHLFIKGTSFSTPQKDVLFIIGDWNAKVGGQEITWSNRQMWPWSTKWLRAKANRVLPRERTGHSKHPLSTIQETDGQYQNQIDYVLCSLRWRSSTQSEKTRPGVDRGSDHELELLIAKFRPKLKKVGKTTRSFRYDLNQIPYDYTVEVIKRSRN